jgi:hypothetical protein
VTGRPPHPGAPGGPPEGQCKKEQEMVYKSNLLQQRWTDNLIRKRHFLAGHRHHAG